MDSHGAPAAAIDVGTNTVLLVIGRARGDGELEVLEDHSRTPRLGEGLARTGRLSEEAVGRALAVLAEYRDRLAARGVPAARVRAVGTACLRRAANPELLIDRAWSELGLAVEVLPEEEEGRLGYLAVTGGKGGDTLVVDVGGGSTEVVSDGGRSLLSAPVGAVVLTETYLGLGGSPPLRGGGWRALRATAEEACARFPAGAAREGGSPRPVVALGGTACNLACLEQGLAAFDPAAAEGARVAGPRVAEWAERLNRTPLAERRALPIEADRAAVLPAGLACLAAAVQRLGARELQVSGRGLRYGVLRAVIEF